jgi:hypothetical protein
MTPLESDLDDDETFKRLYYSCLRAKGYQTRFQTSDSCQIYPRETRRKPNMRDGASDAALASLESSRSIAGMSCLVGDGPVECKAVGAATQEYRWFTNNRTQGFVFVGTAAKTKKPADVACRYSLETGAVEPGSCQAGETR